MFPLVSHELNDGDMDLLRILNRGLIPARCIEVKGTSQVEDKALRAMRAFIDEYNPRKAIRRLQRTGRAARGPDSHRSLASVPAIALGR